MVADLGLDGLRISVVGQRGCAGRRRGRRRLRLNHDQHVGAALADALAVGVPGRQRELDGLPGSGAREARAVHAAAPRLERAQRRLGLRVALAVGGLSRQALGHGGALDVQARPLEQQGAAGLGLCVSLRLLGLLIGRELAPLGLGSLLGPGPGQDRRQERRKRRQSLQGGRRRKMVSRGSSEATALVPQLAGVARGLTLLLGCPPWPQRLPTLALPLPSGRTSSSAFLRAASRSMAGLGA